MALQRSTVLATEVTGANTQFSSALKKAVHGSLVSVLSFSLISEEFVTCTASYQLHCFFYLIMAQSPTI